MGHLWRIAAIFVLCLIWMTVLFTWNVLSNTVVLARQHARPAITATPTGMPGPPTLIAPSDGITLPQPVPPDAWSFRWSARAGPCFSILSADGPHVWQILASVQYGLGQPSYEYHYTRTANFPPSALGQWMWSAAVHCPLGSNRSEVRTFYLLTTTLVHPTNLPILIN